MKKLKYNLLINLKPTFLVSKVSNININKFKFNTNYIVSKKNILNTFLFLSNNSYFKLVS